MIRKIKVGKEKVRGKIDINMREKHCLLYMPHQGSNLGMLQPPELPGQGLKF